MLLFGRGKLEQGIHVYSVVIYMVRSVYSNPRC